MLELFFFFRCGWDWIEFYFVICGKFNVFGDDKYEIEVGGYI